MRLPVSAVISPNATASITPHNDPKYIALSVRFAELLNYSVHNRLQFVPGGRPGEQTIEAVENSLGCCLRKGYEDGVSESVLRTLAADVVDGPDGTAAYVLSVKETPDSERIVVGYIEFDTDCSEGERYLSVRLDDEDAIYTTLRWRLTLLRAAEAQAAEMQATTQHSFAQALLAALAQDRITTHSIAEELDVSQSWVSRRVPRTRAARVDGIGAKLSPAKLTRLRRASSLAQYPGTFRAVSEHVPQELADSLTAAQLAQVIDVMRAQYERGREAGVDAL